MRPWAELIDLVAREESRLGLQPETSAAPSARLMAIVSSLRSIAAHEAERANAATVARARIEFERDMIRSQYERAAEAAEDERLALKSLMLALLRRLETHAGAKRAAGRSRSTVPSSTDRRRPKSDVVFERVA